jgi:hypothetical protein
MKTAEYEMQIVDVDLLHYFEDHINVKIKSKLTITLGDTKIEKQISNTVYINSDEPIYKEILLNSKQQLC